MSRKPSIAARTSLYRLVGIPSLTQAVQQKYLDRPDFTSAKTVVSGRDAMLILGTFAKDVVSWGPTLFGLTGVAVVIANSTAAGILIVRGDGDDGWALCYGMGFQALDQDKVDPGFGQRLAIRTADPREISSLTRTTLDQRSRTDRFSIPSGDHLRGFGVGDFGEVVTRLVAKASIPALAGGATALRIRGADALSVPLGKTPDSLVNDLDILAGLLANPAPDELAVLEQLVPVKNHPDLMESLEAELEGALADDTMSRLGLSWPHERIEENSPPTSFRVLRTGRGDSSVQDNIPELSHVLEIVRKARPGGRLDRVKAMRIQLFRDAEGEDPISAAIPGLKWLAFETERDGKRYCLHDGHWYLMNQGYAQKLKNQTQAIFDRTAGITLPDWPAGMDEADYNIVAANSLGGTSLDRKLIYTEFHHRGIEACDVLAPDGTLIHVKNLDSSAPASHLLAQALVSADALLYDEDARAKFRAKVVAAGGDPASIPDKVQRVVLGVARKGAPPTADNLFTFTQVTLVRGVAALQARGVDVFVVPIQRAP